MVYAPLNAANSLSVTFCFIVTYEHEKINLLIYFFNIICFIFYDVNLNTQDFVFLEFVKYQLGLRRNRSVFAKCNIHISAINLFYIQTCSKSHPI